MAFLLAKNAGPQSFVLVDTGHHYQAQNIEQIVAWLLHHKMMGGFHFNDRRYADDDLTLGSIDPYQVFRIFHEIRMFEWETKSAADIAYMIDQSHNLKDKIEAMIQTVCTAQELYARAALVDHERLAPLQEKCALVDAEETLRGAFWLDVRRCRARMAQVEKFTRRSDAGISREWLYGANQGGAVASELARFGKLRLNCAGRSKNRIGLSGLVRSMLAARKARMAAAISSNAFRARNDPCLKIARWRSECRGEMLRRPAE